MKDGFATTVLSSAKGDHFFGPGHNGEIATIDEHDYLPFHCHIQNATPSQRPLFIQELFWDDEGWPYMSNGGKGVLTSGRPSSETSRNASAVSTQP